MQNGLYNSTQPSQGKSSMWPVLSSRASSTFWRWITIYTVPKSSSSPVQSVGLIDNMQDYHMISHDAKSSRTTIFIDCPSTIIQGNTVIFSDDSYVQPVVIMYCANWRMVKLSCECSAPHCLLCYVSQTPVHQWTLCTISPSTLRYANYCSRGAQYITTHAFSCLMAAFPSIQHDRIQDVTA